MIYLNIFNLLGEIMDKIIYLVILALVIYFLYDQNNHIVKSCHIINHNSIPGSFSGFTIIQLSDIHSKTFGRDNKRILKMIYEVNPDLIVITGDLIEDRRSKEEEALSLINKLMMIAPVYFVPGNHELRYKGYRNFEIRLRNSGVQVIRNNMEKVYLGDDFIYILGIDSPDVNTNEFTSNALNNISKKIETDNFTLLLAHKPELISVYKDYKINLALSGHAHGGQIRIPLVGGLYSPGQGIFPKLTSGIIGDGDYKMIISRGLGPSIFPFRIFNRPELIIVKLKSK